MAKFADVPRARVPVWRRLLGDRLTPVSAFHLLTGGDTADHAFLLESVVGGEHIGRYSFLGVDPVTTYHAQRGRATLAHGKRASDAATGDPLADLRDLLGDCHYYRDPSLPGFTGGFVGFAAYDLVRYYEPAKLGGHDGGPPDDRELPDALFGLYESIIIFDHVDKTIRVVAHASWEKGESPEAAYHAAAGRVDRLVDRMQQAPALAGGEIDPDKPLQLRPRSSLDQPAYEAAVARAIAYIRAGDIFQVVPSLRLRVESLAAPLDVYRALRVINPSPFMLYLRTPACTLIGNSPEILCRVQDRKVLTRPLAGTRRRGGTPEEDAALAAELLADPKERAEHIMLVDLHRNDIGRVARTGTVRVSELMSVERYSHVMHIVTNVQAELDDHFDALDALRVSLPVGTVSGAPKVRAMQIIDELEPFRRGPYGGAVGHIDFSGDMDTCITLRTIVWRNGTYDVQAGAGVVADSVPSREYEECLNKAMAMLQAVQIAETGFQDAPNTT
jgi:anthranilate synthase component 1